MPGISQLPTQQTGCKMARAGAAAMPAWQTTERHTRQGGRRGRHARAFLVRALCAQLAPGQQQFGRDSQPCGAPQEVRGPARGWGWDRG